MKGGFDFYSSVVVEVVLPLFAIVLFIPPVSYRYNPPSVFLFLSF